MGVINRFLDRLFGPTSKFEIGDSVELAEGSNLMVIISITKGQNGEPLIHCQWTELDTGIKRIEIYSEADLKPIDWYRREI